MSQAAPFIDHFYTCETLTHHHILPSNSIWTQSKDVEMIQVKPIFKVSNSSGITKLKLQAWKHYTPYLTVLQLCCRHSASSLDRSTAL